MSRVPSPDLDEEPVGGEGGRAAGPLDHGLERLDVRGDVGWELRPEPRYQRRHVDVPRARPVRYPGDRPPVRGRRADVRLAPRPRVDQLPDLGRAGPDDRG